MNSKKLYILPQLNVINIDSEISLQMESNSHTVSNPPTEDKNWELQFNQSTSVQPYQDAPVTAPINENLDLLN
ncbi:MAG: hypothetical protein LBV75_06885 [Paludibacter sp.]|jgi:hypothetical protein|nr:hypothetical protein [Paludibacter sp.]